MAVALAENFLLLPFDLLTSTGFLRRSQLGLQNAYAPCDIGFQLSFCAVLGVQAAAALTRPGGRLQGRMRLSGCSAAWQSRCKCRALPTLPLPLLVAPRHGGQSGGHLQSAGRLDAAARALQMGILLLAQRCTVFSAVYNLVGLLLSLWLETHALVGRALPQRCRSRRFICRSGTHAVCAGGAGGAGGGCLLVC